MCVLAIVFPTRVNREAAQGVHTRLSCAGPDAQASLAWQTWGQWAKSFVASTVAETVDIADLDSDSRKILQEAVEQVRGGGGAVDAAGVARLDWSRRKFLVP